MSNPKSNLLSPKQAEYESKLHSQFLALPASIAVFFIFFPYIKIIPSQSDLQPCALITSTLFLFLSFFLKKDLERLTPAIWLSAFVLLYAIAIWFFLGSHYGVRDLAGFFSFFIISASSYLFFKKNLIRTLYIKAFILFWFVVGAIQTFIDGNFLTQLLTRNSTTHDRGAIGLAPEPSYYGITCVLLLILVKILWNYQMLKKKESYLLFFLLLIQIIFFARSSIAILALAIYYLLHLSFHFDLKKIALMFFLGILFFCCIKFFLPDTRMTELTTLLFTDPSAISLDDSINVRFAAVFLSIRGFLESLPFAFGHGFNAWDFFLSTQHDFSKFYNQLAGPIMSGYGAVLFQLGYVGCILPCIVFWSFYKKGKKMQVIAFSLTAIMFAAIPIGTPLFALLFGFSEALSNSEIKKASFSGVNQ